MSKRQRRKEAMAHQTAQAGVRKEQHKPNVSKDVSKAAKSLGEKISDIFSEENLLSAGYTLLGVGFLFFVVSLFFPQSMLIAQITLGAWGLGLTSLCIGIARGLWSAPTVRLRTYAS